MNKQITYFGFLLLIIGAIVFSSSTPQQDKKNNKKEQPQKVDKSKDKDAKQAKNNSSNQANDKQPRSKEDKNNADKNNNSNKNPGNNAGGNNDKDKNENARWENNPMKDGYKWDRETFKDRQNYRNTDKVTLCHKFNNNDEPAVTIKVSANAVKAHMAHGDVVGDCPVLTNSRFSEVFIRNRNDYYNVVQNHYEQVSYSRSILDYALQRLAYSRQQLVVMQNSNVPLSDIERKQATIVELEQNASLLETLVGAAAGIVVNKLMN